MWSPPRVGGLADLGAGAELVDVGSLRATLERLLGDAPLRARLGSEARATAEADFGLAASAERLERAYRQALEA